MSRRRIQVRLNCTSANPFEMYGLARNPFPQSGVYEDTGLNYALSILAAHPMPTLEGLMAKLEELGASAEFRQICIKEYRSGEIVKFNIEW
jgi:hypothetical protein